MTRGKGATDADVLAATDAYLSQVNKIHLNAIHGQAAMDKWHDSRRHDQYENHAQKHETKIAAFSGKEPRLTPMERAMQEGGLRLRGGVGGSRTRTASPEPSSRDVTPAPAGFRSRSADSDFVPSRSVSAAPVRARPKRERKQNIEAAEGKKRAEEAAQTDFENDAVKLRESLIV